MLCMTCSTWSLLVCFCWDGQWVRELFLLGYSLSGTLWKQVAWDCWLLCHCCVLLPWGAAVALFLQLEMGCLVLSTPWKQSLGTR